MAGSGESRTRCTVTVPSWNQEDILDIMEKASSQCRASKKCGKVKESRGKWSASTSCWRPSRHLGEEEAWINHWNEKEQCKDNDQKKKKVKDLPNLKSGSGDQQLIKQRFQRQEACMSLIIFLSTKNLLFVHLNFEMLSVIENSLNSSFIHSLDQIYM